MSTVIAIPVETKARELDGKLWLTKNLIARGFKVALGKYSEIMENIDIIRPDVVFAVSAGGPQCRVELFRCLRQQGVRLLALDVEGGIFRTDEGYSVRLGPEILENIDYYLAWGARPGELVSELTEFSRERVIITGEPRFDLLHSKYRKYYYEKGKRLRGRFGRYILVNTNFGMANHFDRSIKEALMTSDDISRLRKPVEEFGFVEHQRKLINEFINAVKRLAEQFTAINFVIRPHPSERHETYSRELAEYGNVYVTAEGDVHAWLAEAECVIHNNCTTGVEAVLLGKPALAYSPITMDGYDLLLPNTISWNAESIDDLSKLIGDVLNGQLVSGVSSLSDEKRQFLERYIANTGGDAAERIAHLVQSICDKDERLGVERRVVNRPLSVKRRIRLVVQRTLGPQMAERVAGILRGKRDRPTSYLYNKQKFDGLAKEEVQTELSRMEWPNGSMSNCGEVVEPIRGTRNCYWCTSAQC